MLPVLLALSLAVGAGLGVAAQNVALGPSTYTVPGECGALFPTSFFSSYYNNPTATVSQVQPVVTDSILNITYPLNLTNPDTISSNDTADPLFYPYTSVNLSSDAATALYNNVSMQIMSIIGGDNSTSNCTKCINSLVAASTLAKQAPSLVPPLMVYLCNYYKFASTAGCNVYMADAQGPSYTQVLAYGNMSGADGQYLCQNFVSVSKCARPTLPKFNSTNFWTKPKPSNATAPVPKGTNRVKVLHMSDFHIDPRYATGAEGNCTSTPCCRRGNPAASLFSNYSLSIPAPRFGWFQCDTPWALGAAAIEAIPVLTGTNGTGFNMTIYTGDLVSHDPYYQLSRAYIEETEASLYDLWKRTLNQGSPLYAAIGNHDSYQQAFEAPHNLPGILSTQFSWNYDHLARLWLKEGWISNATAVQAMAHYGGYSAMHAPNLKVIVINTDLWYRANVFAYINVTAPDNFGFLGFLASELQDAEDRGIRAYVMGHVLSGWDGTNPLLGPTDAFYQIVDRYSHVIAGVFWGHTHEDQNIIYYANNGTNASAATAQNVAWIGPSVVPLTNLNSGFRMYEVDGDTWDILDAHTWYSNVSTYQALDNTTAYGPSYQYEYNTRQAYGGNISWPSNAPLNATWWHMVTDQMGRDNGTLVSLQNKYQGKLSARTSNCTSATCVQAKICYLRSGSAPIALANCPTGFGSVQGG